MMESSNSHGDKSISYQNGTFNDWFTFSTFLVVLIILHSLNFLLYHTLVEIFSLIFAFGIFVVASNTHNISKSDYFLSIGVGYLFVGFFDVLHALAYPGIGIFSGITNNFTVQIWIAGRYMEGITLLLSCILIFSKIKKIKFPLVFLTYSVLFGIGYSLIFHFKVFPVCFIDGIGATQFKIYSEYGFILICLFVAVLLYKIRKRLDNKLFFYVELAFVLKIISEILFNQFHTISDWIILTAHILKVVSFFCIYRGVIKIALQLPFDALFSKLYITDTELKNEHNRRSEIEKVLISNERCYELLIENSNDAIYVHSMGRVIFANQGAAKLAGVSSEEELIGLSIDRFLHPDYKEFMLKRVEQAYKHQSSVPFAEVKVVDINGKVIDAESTTTFFSYNGQPAALSILRDISSRKRVEELKKDVQSAKELSRIQTEFFANISHELKTPLNVLLGSIQILGLPSEENLPSNFQGRLSKYLWTMKQNCYRLLRLVNNLIDLSKVDSGYLKLNLRNYNIVSIVEDITLSVADYIENKGVELIFDTDTEEKIMAVDADKIERVILNLLSNSIKFTNPGDKIFVSIMDNSGSVIISVKDTGIGIPEDKLNLIFDRFAQVDRTLSRNREGSGIGLALVKSLIDIHGGSIGVNSILGEGSEFIIEIPVRLVESEDTTENLLYQSKIERISIEFSDIYIH